MEMQHVRYFLAPSRTLNLTGAAERAGVTQPALTRGIQKLEAELGGALFHREGRRTHQSELGRTMLPYFEGIQAQADAARSQAMALKSLEHATLHIGAICTVGPAIVSDLVVAFRTANPGVGLRVSDMAAAERVERLADGDLDVGLFGLPEGLDDRFHAVPLFQERFVVAVPREHRFAQQNVVRAEELHEENYVSRASCEYFDHARQAFHGRQLIDPAFERTIMLVTVRGRPHSPAVGAFVRQARAFSWLEPRDLG